MINTTSPTKHLTGSLTALAILIVAATVMMIGSLMKLSFERP
jgi:hypothetical protein